MQLINIVYQTLTVLLFLSYTAGDGNSNFAINSPIETTSWNGGKTVTISWYLTKEVPENTQVTFSLVQGESSNLKKITDLGKASLNAKQLTVQLPNFSSGTDYAIKAESQGLANYSHYFTVMADPDAEIESAGSPVKPTEIKNKETSSSSSIPSSTSSASSSSSSSSSPLSSASSSKSSTNSTSSSVKKSDSSRLDLASYFTIVSLLMTCTLLR